MVSDDDSEVGGEHQAIPPTPNVDESYGEPSNVNKNLDNDDINPAKIIVMSDKHNSQGITPNDSELYISGNLFDVMLPEEKYESDALASSDIEFRPTQCNGEYIQVVTPLEHTEEGEIHAKDDDKSKKRSRKQNVPVKTRITKTYRCNNEVTTNILSNKVEETTSDGNEGDLEIGNIETFVVTVNGNIGDKNNKKKCGAKKKIKHIFTCLDCHKTFSYKCNLQLHAATHSDEKQYSCPICNKMFKLKAHLDTHRKVHQEYYEFKCELCGKEFKLKGNMKTHIKTKHFDERTHECTQCDRTFKMRQHLLTHIRIKHSVS